MLSRPLLITESEIMIGDPYVPLIMRKATQNDRDVSPQQSLVLYLKGKWSVQASSLG